MRYNPGDPPYTQMQPGIRNLTVQNLLSFGEMTTIDLRPLNVLIGPNGSGKSNLIEVLGLLQNAPKDLATAISNGGPIDDWLWKGAAKTPTASIWATVARPVELQRDNPEAPALPPCVHEGRIPVPNHQRICGKRRPRARSAGAGRSGCCRAIFTMLT